MAKEMSQKAALASLNNFFRDDIKPVNLDQVHALDNASFGRWVRRSKLQRRQKRRLRRLLKPLSDAQAIAGVVLRGATLIKEKEEVDVVVLGIPNKLKDVLRGSDMFVIYAESGESEDDDPDGGDDGGGDDNQQDTCQYSKCFCANPNNCSCVSATQFNKECPEDECSSDGDCGGGSSGAGGISVPQVLGAF